MQSDRIMLTHMVGASETAVYSLVYNIGSILIALYTAINGSWTPWFYKKLDEVEAQLEQMNIKFLRISKSYLVNVNYVKEFRYEKVVMDDGKEFKIGPRYKDKIRKSYIELMRIS